MRRHSGSGANHQARDAGGRVRAKGRPPSGSGRGGEGPAASTQVIFGKHSVRATFAARPHAVRRVVMREGASRYLQEFIDIARAHGIEPELLRSSEFLRVGDLDEDDKHQGIFVIADRLEPYTERDLDLLRDASLVLVLDQINNPQNFGTMIRTAAFFGVDAVVWLKNRAVDVTPTVARVAVGATELVRLFRVTNLVRTLETLKESGFWIYGLDERGDRALPDVRFDARTALVVGAEGEGLRQLTRRACDELVHIPGGRPGLGSLNAAVAGAIAMAAAAHARDRGAPPPQSS